MVTRPSLRLAAAVVSLAVSAALLPACSSSAKSNDSASKASSAGSSAASGPSVTIDGVKISQSATLRAQLPATYLSKGSFVYVTNGLGPPRSSVDASGKIVGAVPDLLAAIAAEWGITATPEKADFSAEVPGVQSGRYDIAADTGDFASRLTAVDMVDFLVAGVAFVVAAGNPKKVTGLDESLCGLTVAVTTGTSQETEVNGETKKCTADGKPAVKVLSLASGSLEVPITAGRADAAFDNTSTAAALVQQSPKEFSLGGSLIIQANLGFSVNKTNTQFMTALKNALQALFDNGAYKAILKQWNQSELALTSVTTNTGAPTP